MNLVYLLVNFFKIGLFSIGGGLATLPFLFEIADGLAAEGANAWLTREGIGNMLAVAQSLPGAIGVNLAAYTGFRYAGISGAYVSAIGLTAPSIIIIIIVARVLRAFKESAAVKSLFSGFRPAAAGLLSAAGFGAITLALWNSDAGGGYASLRPKETVIFAVLFLLIYKFKKHPAVYIIAAGALGALLKL